ncbi:Telomere repeat-binding factor 3 [Platanthera guangdongensis]|uniref:Telomere repeat-binding factor 3 n=1 Tax=Platanthera guangdongensis TaxID=2320717 RepID=A0ABR2LMN9_9ASPA
MADAPAPEPQNSKPSASFVTTSGRVTGLDVSHIQTWDNNTASSTLEFILRQPAIPDFVVNAAFLALPLSYPISPRLKTAILFRRLASDLALRSVSEKTLEIFELIEELDRETRKSRPSQAMKSAYCAVASSCTAAALRQNVDAFLDCFHRIWVLRFSDIEKSPAAALISEELYEVRNIFWEAVKDPEIRGLVENMDLEETLDLVRDYLEQVWNMEPLFPDIAIDEIVEDSQARRENTGLSGFQLGKGEGLAINVEEQQFLKSSDSYMQRVVQDTVLNPGNKARELLVENPEKTCGEQFKGNDGLDRSIELVSNSEIGFGDTRTEGKETDCDKEKTIRSNHQRMMQSTLLDAANKAIESPAKNPEEPCDEELRGNDGHHRRDEMASTSAVGAQDTITMGNEAGTVLEKHPDLSCLQKMEEIHSTSVEKVPDSSHHGENYSTKNICNADSLPRSSLMEKNQTAHTFEWTDSPLQEGRLRLHTPERKARSPLKLIDDDRKLTKRRKIRKWTLLEEDTLRTAVTKYGKGSWKLILGANLTVFEERTEVDLKDKWRNMTRNN